MATRVKNVRRDARHEAGYRVQEGTGSVEPAQRQEAGPRCVHYWLIEPALGPTSRGVCRYCGEEREFFNYQGDFSWEDSASSLADPFNSSDVLPDGEDNRN